MRILPALALAIIAAAVLAACGGSDDDDAPTRRPRDAAEATSTPFLDRQATNTQAPVTTRPATALPGSPLTSPTVTPSVAPVVAFPARRADGAIQRDPCGKYTIVREAVTVPGQKFPSADKITVLTADGNLVVELKNDEPFTNVGVDWCYDVNADGNPELSVYTFSGGAHCCITQAIYSFAAAKSSLFLLYQAGNAGSLTPKELDGKPPIELTGFDDRLAYFGGISYAASPTLVTVYAGRDGKYVEATKDFKPVIEQYRSQLVSQFRTCESQPADQRFQCQQGLGLGIMAESLVIGDWDTFVGTLNPPANVRDWLASHRAELVAELAKPKPQ